MIDEHQTTQQEMDERYGGYDKYARISEFDC